MRSLIALVVASLFLITFMAPAQAGSASGRYVTGPGAFALWCSEDEHALLPQGDPNDGPVPWLLSGEPECAGADAYNGLREAQGEEREQFGINGFAFLLPAGTTFFAVGASDELGGGPPMTVMGAEICGAGAAVLFPPLGQDTLVWVYIDTLAVGPDADVCFGSTGTIAGSWA